MKNIDVKFDLNKKATEQKLQQALVGKSFQHNCPLCGKPMNLTISYQTQFVVCPHCKKTIQINIK